LIQQLPGRIANPPDETIPLRCPLAERARRPFHLLISEEQSMTREPVLIRVDANPQTGYERIARCLTLAAALQRRRRTAHFLSNLEPASLAPRIKRHGNEWIATDRLVGDRQDLRQTTQEIRKLKPAAIIVDDANVTGSEPAIDEGCRIGVRVFPIAVEDRRTARKDFACAIRA
jgi:hypothetical protein